MPISDLELSYSLQRASIANYIILIFLLLTHLLTFQSYLMTSAKRHHTHHVNTKYTAV